MKRIARATKIGETTINEMVGRMHEIALSKGWWDDEPSIGESISLMHSELSEALEEARAGFLPNEIYYQCKNKEACPDDQYISGDCSSKKCIHAKPCGIATELADCVIRIFNFCGKNKIDLEKVISEKVYFNEHRPHKHGKIF